MLGQSHPSHARFLLASLLWHQMLRGKKKDQGRTDDWEALGRNLEANDGGGWWPFGHWAPREEAPGGWAPHPSPRGGTQPGLLACLREEAPLGPSSWVPEHGEPSDLTLHLIPTVI